MTRPRSRMRVAASAEPQPHLEVGTTVEIVSVEDGTMTVAGDLVFERRGPRLVMVTEPRVEAPPTPKLRRPFTATLSRSGDRITVVAFEVTAGDDAEGVTSKVLRAT